jgi:DNA repair and recombination protein RAD52
MADIQVFTEKQIKEFEKPLDQRLVSNRKGGGNNTLKYIEGHDAIDQANRLFGYGNWASRPLSCEQSVLLDPLTGEAVGIAYKAQVELIVRGCVAPIVEVGSQPVATWNVEDQIMKSRISAAKYNKKPVDESPFTYAEKSRARAVIADAHEMAEKGAVTDALKRALRTFGDQFGNGLYGDGRVMIGDEDDYVDAGDGSQVKVSEVRPNQQRQAAPKRVIDSKPAPAQLPPASKVVESKPVPPAQPQAIGATERQKELITRYCDSLKYPLPINFDTILEDEAARLINKYHQEYKQRQQQAS